MSSHATCPYRSMPDHAFWKRVVAGVQSADVNPVLTPPFRIRSSDKVATAGSCFAQHIARHLRTSGIEPFVVEKAPEIIDQETALDFQYGVYSARYGNIYTARQLLQLFDRAFGQFCPVDEAWQFDSGFIDPYRPSVQPNGFATIEELRLDREQHLRQVRRMFEELDVFVFTLGLTEAWINSRDGAVYPVCPGCGWGKHDADSHEFKNFDATEVADDLIAFLQRLRKVNPGSRVVLTVSPVPLAATASTEHVLAATSLSKSKLRVAADLATRSASGIAYFPSYEIITSSSNRGKYFADDLRTVLPEGVKHVMRTFSLAYLDGSVGEYREPGQMVKPHPSSHADTLSTNQVAIDSDSAGSHLVDIICEEDQLDALPRASS